MTQPSRLRLTGSRCQCPTCGDYFANPRAFDRHRVGEFGDCRRCLTIEEMNARGWVRNGRGFWLTHDPRRAGATLTGHNATLPATPVPSYGMQPTEEA